jgi:hypothetical protein
MKKFFGACFSFCVVICSCSDTEAQAPAPTPGSTSFYDWFKNANISIRKSFDGSKKDEEKPANFFWGHDFHEKFDFTTIDAGLKISQIELLKHTNSALLFFPKLEWHKDGSNKDKKKSSFATGINAEFFPVRARTNGLPGGLKLAPFILGSFDYQNDYIKKLRTIKPKGFLSFFSNATGLPGSSIRSGGLFFRYYPYTGFEYFQSTDSTSKRASYWTSRLFFELYPIAAGKGDFVQITFDYSYRVKVKDNLYQKGNVNWLSVGLNIYPDGKGKIGFGLDYSRGDDPANSFAETDKISFGLKLKF